MSNIDPGSYNRNVRMTSDKLEQKGRQGQIKIGARRGFGDNRASKCMRNGAFKAPHVDTRSRQNIPNTITRQTKGMGTTRHLANVWNKATGSNRTDTLNKENIDPSRKTVQTSIKDSIYFKLPSNKELRKSIKRTSETAKLETTNEETVPNAKAKKGLKQIIKDMFGIKNRKGLTKEVKKFNKKETKLNKALSEFKTESDAFIEDLKKNEHLVDSPLIEYAVETFEKIKGNERLENEFITYVESKFTDAQLKFISVKTKNNFQPNKAEVTTNKPAESKRPSLSRTRSKSAPAKQQEQSINKPQKKARPASMGEKPATSVSNKLEDFVNKLKSAENKFDYLNKAVKLYKKLDDKGKKELKDRINTLDKGLFAENFNNDIRDDWGKTIHRMPSAKKTDKSETKTIKPKQKRRAETTGSFEAKESKPKSAQRKRSATVQPSLGPKAKAEKSVNQFIHGYENLELSTKDKVMQEAVNIYDDVRRDKNSLKKFNTFMKETFNKEFRDEFKAELKDRKTQERNLEKANDIYGKFIDTLNKHRTSNRDKVFTKAIETYKQLKKLKGSNLVLNDFYKTASKHFTHEEKQTFDNYMNTFS